MQKPILLYQTADTNIKVEVIYIDENFWLTQKAIAQLFGVESNTVTYHLKEIFKSGELEEISVTRKIRATASDGKNYNTSFYNLDAIIAIGYRVNSKQATQFRIWATVILKIINPDKFLKPVRISNESNLNYFLLSNSILYASR